MTFNEILAGIVVMLCLGQVYKILMGATQPTPGQIEYARRQRLEERNWNHFYEKPEKMVIEVGSFAQTATKQMAPC